MARPHGTTRRAAAAEVFKGEDTTAELWLPVSEGVAEPAPPVEHTLAGPSRPLSVMVVDDDSLVADEHHPDAASCAGLEATSFCSWLRAIRKLQRGWRSGEWRRCELLSTSV